MISEARKTYDGPMVFAQDYMVFNITKNEIKVRTSAYDEEIFPEPATRPKQTPSGDSLTFSKFILSGREPFPEVVKPMWDEINEAWGTDLKPPQ